MNVTRAGRRLPNIHGRNVDIAAPATFLFTDIEGSTEKWEQQPEHMAKAVAAHDALLLDAVKRNRGRLIKTNGDGILAVFADPVDGIEAVVAIQLRLTDPAATAGIPLAVRCGLHAGQAHRHGDDYVGTTVNRTARIMGLAHGGQVLLSQAVADQLVHRLPKGTALRALGDVRLKGFVTTERVHQLLHPRLREAFPALRSLEATPSNLPQLPTSFVGREGEIADIARLLARTRLLTLFGIGGLGKTRLALKIAGNVLDRYRDGVWFVDLAPIRDGALVQREVASVLGIREEPGRPLLQTLCTNLKTRTLLLILDNCEHLVSACAELAAQIVRATPDVQILATSRESLRVPGERTYAVMPLPVPRRGPRRDELLESTAVRLFIERARQHRPSFGLDGRDVDAVAELVTRLEGIPLALELAAARLRTLALREINARLEDRYKLLAGGGRGVVARQQTLRALIDWSYELLSRPEQVLLQRLSCFAGGCDVDAMEDVCSAEPLARDDLVDLLTSLVDKSLVIVEERDEGVRYRMLETIRDYAKGKLIEDNEVDHISSSHCNYYLAMARMGSAGLQGPEQAHWIARLETEHDNLRAAIKYAAREGGDPIIAVKIEVALQAFRLYRGYVTEGRNNLSVLLAHPAIVSHDVARGHALYVSAALSYGQADYREAQRLLETCLALRRGLGKEGDTAATLSTLALVRLRLGDAVGATVAEEEALATFRTLGNRSGEAIGLQHLGEICRYVGADDDAEHFLRQSLALGCEIGYSEIESECERLFGQIALDRGQLDLARVHVARSLATSRAQANTFGIAMASWWLAKIELADNQSVSALPFLGDAITAFHAFGMNEDTIGVIEDYAQVARAVGLTEEAARLYGVASAATERQSLLRAPRVESSYRSNLDSLRAALGGAAFENAWREGREWGIAQAIDRIFALFDDMSDRR